MAEVNLIANTLHESRLYPELAVTSQLEAGAFGLLSMG